MGQVLPGHRHFAGANRHHAVQVQASGQLTVVGRALGIGITVHQRAFEQGIAAKTGPIAIQRDSASQAAQGAVVNILLIGQRGILVALAVT